MPISQTDFAEAFRKLRPGLIQMARHLRRCRYEDAEDLASEVVLYALPRLREVDAETGTDGLRQWLSGILYRIVQHDYRSEACQGEPLALYEAGDVMASAGDIDPPAFDKSVRALPLTHRRLVSDWLDGYSQDEIGRRNRLHRNTVAIRLEEAFAALRLAFPDAEALAYSFALFAFCARVSLYRKPKAPWKPWLQQHPPERRFHRSAPAPAPTKRSKRSSS